MRICAMWTIESWCTFHSFASKWYLCFAMNVVDIQEPFLKYILYTYYVFWMYIHLVHTICNGTLHYTRRQPLHFARKNNL